SHLATETIEYGYCYCDLALVIAWTCVVSSTAILGSLRRESERCWAGWDCEISKRQGSYRDLGGSGAGGMYREWVGTTAVRVAEGAWYRVSRGRERELLVEGG